MDGLVSVLDRVVIAPVGLKVNKPGIVAYGLNIGCFPYESRNPCDHDFIQQTVIRIAGMAFQHSTITFLGPDSETSTDSKNI